MSHLPTSIIIFWSTKNVKKSITIKDSLFFKASFYHINHSEFLVLIHTSPRMITAKGKKHCTSYMVFLEHEVVVICPYAN
jgi:hypothetical protein